MRRDYLGDSYDIVKRFWAERLSPIAPLFAHPRFVPIEIRPVYERLTGMRVLQEEVAPTRPFGLFLDPHTGISLPDARRQRSASSHTTPAFIVEILADWEPRYLICFDQAHDRLRGLTRIEQRRNKSAALHEQGISSFYYVSHAAFLFASIEQATLAEIRRCLLESGLPAERLEAAES